MRTNKRKNTSGEPDKRKNSSVMNRVEKSYMGFYKGESSVF